MRMQSFLKAALTFAAGFALCVFDFFGIGMVLITAGLLMFCMVPSASKGKQAAGRSGAAKTASAVKKFYPPVSGAPAPDAYAYSGSVDRYFAELLPASFPDCTIRENVSPAALGRSSGAASWECSCGTANTGKFCSECGKARPNTGGRTVTAASGRILSFVLYRNNTPCAAVILCGKYDWDLPEIHDAMNACERANVPCLRFMKEFRNSAGYVVGRINSVLR